MNRAIFWATGVAVSWLTMSVAWATPAGEGGVRPERATPPILPMIGTTPAPASVRLPGVDYKKPWVLSEEEALSLALRHSPRMQVARALVGEACGKRISGSASLGPQVNLNTAYSGYSRLSGAQLANSGSYSLVLEQLLWDCGRAESERDSLRASERQARYEQADVCAALVRDVRVAFYQLVAKRRLADVALANLDNRRSNLKMTRAKWEAGVGLPADVVRAESLVSTATLNVNAARAEWVAATIRLANLLGLDVLLPLDPIVPTELPPDNDCDDLHALAEVAYARRPDVLAARAKVEAAEHTLRAAEQANAPVLTATLGAVGRGNVYPAESSALVGGLELSWPLYDSGDKDGRVIAAAAVRDRQVAEFEQLKQDVAADIASCSVVLRTALGSLEAADNAETCSREAVRIAEGRYSAGIGTFLEVIDAQNSLLSSSNALVNALLAVWEARVQFDYAIGVSEFWLSSRMQSDQDSVPSTGIIVPAGGIVPVGGISHPDAHPDAPADAHPGAGQDQGAR